jgi:hypothetical protein
MRGLRPVSSRFAVTAILLAVALVVSHAQPAHAHRSYAVPQKTLDFGDGRTATLEILYGDGIFFADPARAQLRTKEGATVAKTPVDGHAVTFCPSVAYCWVFLYGPFPIPWRLNPDEIAWHSPAEPNPYFPEYDDTPPVGFAADWTPWSFLLGFAVLIISNWLGLGAMLLPWLLIVLITRWVRAVGRRHWGQSWWSIALSGLLWIALIAYELLALYFLVALSAFPLVLLVLLLAGAMFGLIKLLNWFAERRLRQPRSA